MFTRTRFVIAAAALAGLLGAPAAAAGAMADTWNTPPAHHAIADTWNKAPVITQDTWNKTPTSVSWG